MTVTEFQDLPLVSRDHDWDRDLADERVRELTGATDEPTPAYRDAHLWYDEDAPQNFTSYKLLVADVVDGRLVVVPRAVQAAAGVLQGARGGVDLPADEVAAVRGHVERYYRKMGDEPPWGDEEIPS
jgi:hypothetical protein